MLCLRVLGAFLSLATLGCSTSPPPSSDRQSPSQPAAETAAANDGARELTPDADLSVVAYSLLELATNQVVGSSHDDWLDTPIPPGSIAKVATLLAALDAGVITPDTKLMCTRTTTVDGRTVSCSHPVLSRPLGPAEALAHSCNVYFAHLARHLSRARLDGAFTSLGFGPAAPNAHPLDAAIGLDGRRLSARELLNIFVRLLHRGVLTTSENASHRVLREGLTGAAQYGTASALGRAGLAAFAKTGTAQMGGTAGGLVVALAPTTAPTHATVVLAPGAAGRDAAEIAATLLAPVVHAATEYVRLGIARAQTYDVESVALEEYVARVVSAESAPDAPRSALEALAITARTYAVRNKGRHAAEGFDLCDLSHCQVTRRATESARQAARSTLARVLTVGSRPASVFYSASCGGTLESAANVWPEGSSAALEPWLSARPDPAGPDDDRWETELSVDQLKAALAQVAVRGTELLDLQVANRSSSGRVAQLHLVGLVPDLITGEDFRLAIGRALGWQHLKSTLFSVTRTARGYRFDGRGLGHGVGMCVRGSARLAAAGHSADEILTAYFPGLEVKSLNATSHVIGKELVSGGAGLSGRPADRAEARYHRRGNQPIQDQSTSRHDTEENVQIVLAAEDEGRREELGRRVGQTIRDLARETGTALPGSLRVQWHPTVESYQRATGRPWWTAGATRLGEDGTIRIDLIPLRALEERRTAEETLRHELVHALLDSQLTDRPLWVREGAAMHFAGERVSAGQGACPTDEELISSASADASRKAYARAAACFEQALKQDQDWRQIR